MKRPKTGGRTKGTPNKTTAAVREAIQHVLSSTQDQTLGWLQSVAEGEKEFRFDDEGQALLNDKGEQLFDWIRRPEPGTALKLWAELAEFIQPKLARTEMAIDPQANALKIAVEFVSVGKSPVS